MSVKGPPEKNRYLRISPEKGEKHKVDVDPTAGKSKPDRNQPSSHFAKKTVDATRVPQSHGASQSADALSPSKVFPKTHHERGGSDTQPKPVRPKSTVLRKIKGSITPPEIVADAQALFKAMKGLSTDEDSLYKILEHRSPQAREALEAEFDRRYGKVFSPLRSAIKDDFSGAELQRAMEGLNAGRRWAPPIGSPQFNRLLDDNTNSVQRRGNSVDLLFDGAQSFDARKQLIHQATKSIYLQTFIFNDDDTGWELARDLVTRAQEGVDVRVIYDGVGSLRADSLLFEYMVENGVKVREYGDPLEQFWDLNDRWHEKHLIVDQEISIEGGMNIADEYAFGGSGRLVFSRDEKAEEPWRDVDVQLRGPVVQDSLRAFSRNWESLGGTKPTLHPKPPHTAHLSKSNTSVRFVQHRPDEDGDQHTRDLHLQAIASATESLTIETAYFMPPSKLLNALVNAARRGVKVRIMTNSEGSTDFPIVAHASRYFYDELLEAGAQLFEKEEGTLHSKTMTVDGTFSVVGSVNLNGRSQWRDSESVVAISGPATASALEKRFESGISQCKAITKSELDEESLLTNLKQWAISCFAFTM